MAEATRDGTGEVLIVTGMSGAGRSTVANALEDHDWYVVDNLPPQMLRPLLDLAERVGGALPRVAAVVDVRGGDLFAELPEVMRTPARRQSRAAGVHGRVRRGARAPLRGGAPPASAAGRRHDRRRHPPRDGSASPRCARAPTSSSTPPATTSTSWPRRCPSCSRAEGAARHILTVMSFGFKYGLPPDADMVADMRFLPNPFWNEDLRALNGEDEAVRDYVLAQEGAAEFIDAYAASLDSRHRGLRAREQAPLDRRHGLHGRQAPFGGHRDRAREPAPRRSPGWPCG